MSSIKSNRIHSSGISSRTVTMIPHTHEVVCASDLDLSGLVADLDQREELIVPNYVWNKDVYVEKSTIPDLPEQEGELMSIGEVD